MNADFEKVQQLISKIEEKILENSLEKDFLLQTLDKILKEIEDFDGVDTEKLENAKLEIWDHIDKEWNFQSGLAANDDDERHQPINNQQVKRAEVAFHGVLISTGTLLGAAGTLLFLGRPLGSFTRTLASGAADALASNAFSRLADAIASYTTRDSNDE